MFLGADAGRDRDRMCSDQRVGDDRCDRFRQDNAQIAFLLCLTATLMKNLDFTSGNEP